MKHPTFCIIDPPEYKGQALHFTFWHTDWPEPAIPNINKALLTCLPLCPARHRRTRRL